MINLNKISSKDSFCRFYVGIEKDKVKYFSYFRSLLLLFPILRTNINNTATGVYVNTNDWLDGVRISCFTKNIKHTEEAVDKYIGFDNKKLFRVDGITKEFSLRYIEETYSITKEILSVPYKIEETKLRKFLCLCTQIGLDLIEENFILARKMVLRYRLQEFPIRRHPSFFFGAYLRNNSATYNSLSEEEKENFLNNLFHWEDKEQVDLAHFLVNMILPGDFVQKDIWAYLSTLNEPISIDEINKICAESGLDIRI